MVKRGSIPFVLVSLLALSACGDDNAPTPKAADTPAARTVETPATAIPSWAKVAPEQIAEAKKHGVPVAVENELGMRFVLIPAGTFRMGSPEEEDDPEADYFPEHQVTITKPFYMATTETTQAAWNTVDDENPSETQGASLPVTNVSREDCAEFIERLNKTVSNGRYRLPTEAQWEFACRAGTTTEYWSGDEEQDLARVAWYFRTSGSKRLPSSAAWDHGKLAEWGCRLHAVGEKPANNWGLHDMHGNVWEWCHDTYERYESSAVTDPVSEGPGNPVLRGGSGLFTAWTARSAHRTRSLPGLRRASAGFRLVSPLPEKSK